MLFPLEKVLAKNIRENLHVLIFLWPLCQICELLKKGNDFFKWLIWFWSKRFFYFMSLFSWPWYSYAIWEIRPWVQAFTAVATLRPGFGFLVENIWNFELIFFYRSFFIIFSMPFILESFTWFRQNIRVWIRIKTPIDKNSFWIRTLVTFMSQWN